jgi:hypothetical protein
MADKKPSFKKSFLILLLVLTPPFWLLFTDEGARVSDTALLWLLGEDEIKLDLGALDASFTRGDIRKVYSEPEWSCGEQATPFGEALCAARIGTFNGFPAQLLTFYFRGDNVSAVQLIYRSNYHQQILGHYIGRFGQPDNVAEAIAEGPDAAEVLEWTLDNGILVMKKTLTESDEPALIWLAAPSP